MSIPFKLRILTFPCSRPLRCCWRDDKLLSSFQLEGAVSRRKPFLGPLTSCAAFCSAQCERNSRVMPNHREVKIKYGAGIARFVATFRAPSLHLQTKISHVLNTNSLRPCPHSLVKCRQNVATLKTSQIRINFKCLSKALYVKLIETRNLKSDNCICKLCQ